MKIYSVRLVSAHWGDTYYLFFKQAPSKDDILNMLDKINRGEIPNAFTLPRPISIQGLWDAVKEWEDFPNLQTDIFCSVSLPDGMGMIHVDVVHLIDN